jgi:hypothetical protein
MAEGSHPVVAMTDAEQEALASLRHLYGRRWQIWPDRLRPSQPLSWHAARRGGGIVLSEDSAECLRLKLSAQPTPIHPGPLADPPRSCESVTLDEVRGDYPAWRIGPSEGGKFTATSGDGLMSVTGRSPYELKVLLENEAWKPRTARNPGLPPGKGT